MLIFSKTISQTNIVPNAKSIHRQTNFVQNETDDIFDRRENRPWNFDERGYARADVSSRAQRQTRKRPLFPWRLSGVACWGNREASALWGEAAGRCQ